MSPDRSAILEEKLSNLPVAPGVYLYKDSKGKIIYVGKAKSLRHRVRSYFQESRSIDFKLDHLCAEIADLEYIVVDNEMEALALENNFIKKNKPKFNILLRDDKTYPYIKLTINEPYPRIFVTRRVKKDGALYFGPYFPASLAHRTFKLMSRWFQIRTCSMELDGKRPRVCLDFHIKRCMGPCVASVCNREEYFQRVLDLKLFMEGKRVDLVDSLTRKMEAAALEERFELAAHLRDTIRTIDQLSEPQRISAAHVSDVDVYALYREAHMAAAQLFHMRGGKVVDRREFFWEDLSPAVENGDVLSSLLKQYYFSSDFTPDEVLVATEFEDREVLEAFLAEHRKKRVQIIIPRRGAKRKLMELVSQNAKLAFDQRFRVLSPSAVSIAESLANLLALDAVPQRIECFDISNIQGTDSVASMVVWENGRMKKSDYRKFIIKTVEGADDFKSMREVIFRRYRRLKEEGSSLPDLVLVDGGVGQLHAAESALEELDLPTQPLASIAKREEIIYVRGSEEDPVILDKHSPVLHLIQMIRDETHRFAVTFHRQRRGKRTLTSGMTEIAGVGEKTARLLLRKFGSIAQIQQLSADQLAQAVHPALARRIYEHFHTEAMNADVL